MRRFNHAFGVRHEAQHVPRIIQNPRDTARRAVDLIEVAECDAAIALQPVERGVVGLKVSIVVGDWESDLFAGLILGVNKLWLFSTRSGTVRHTNLSAA